MAELNARIKLVRDDHGNLGCPVPVIEVYTADDDRPEVTHQGPCKQELHLVVTSTAGLSCWEDDPHRIDLGPGCPSDAHVWKVECGNGHVLATSTYDGYGQSDSPAFSLDWLPFDIPAKAGA